MITLYIPAPIEYVFRQLSRDSIYNPEFIQRMKLIFSGSVLSAYAINTLVNFSSFSDVLLESYKTLAYIVSVVALPLLGVLVSCQVVIKLYEVLWSPTVESDDDLGVEPNPDKKHTYNFIYENYLLKADAIKKGYVEEMLLNFCLEKKVKRLDYLLKYLENNKIEFNKDDGFYRKTPSVIKKQELELKLVSYDISNGNLRDFIKTSNDDGRNLACSAVKDLIKSCQLFPHGSQAYEQLKNGQSEEKDFLQKVLNLMDDPKKNIFVKLLRHLNRIAADSKKHLMDARSLAVVFVPNIDSEPDTSKAMNNNSRFTNILTKMIEQASSLSLQ